MVGDKYSCLFANKGEFHRVKLMRGFKLEESAFGRAWDSVPKTDS